MRRILPPKTLIGITIAHTRLPQSVQVFITIPYVRLATNEVKHREKNFCIFKRSQLSHTRLAKHWLIVLELGGIEEDLVPANTYRLILSLF